MHIHLGKMILYYPLFHLSSAVTPPQLTMSRLVVYLIRRSDCAYVKKLALKCATSGHDISNQCIKHELILLHFRAFWEAFGTTLQSHFDLDLT